MLRGRVGLRPSHRARPRGQNRVDGDRIQPRRQRRRLRQHRPLRLLADAERLMTRETRNLL